MSHYDALLLVSFGGPEARDEVMPFLRNVVRGRNVPDERLASVAEHYYLFEGKSPINQQNRDLLDAIRKELGEHGTSLPVYWGNRNWHPLLADTLREMARDGVRRALAFVTSAYSSYSGCRQYREDIARAQEEVGEGAPEVDKIRAFFNHPGFIEANRERLGVALQELAASEPPHVLFTAHSLPMSMAETSDYQAQLEETARLVADGFSIASSRLVYQSRSGPPSQPWLEPDVLDATRELHGSGARAVVLAPVGFVSDHMEVAYDLDVEAKQLAEELGLELARARTAGTHPAFVRMVRSLVEERTTDESERPALGNLGPRPDVCPADCCPPPVRRHV